MTESPAVIVRTLTGTLIVGAGLIGIIGSGSGSGIQGPFSYAGPSEPLPPPVDNPPFANAGEDQTVTEAALVKLHGSGFDEEDNVYVQYHWQQELGPAVNLSDPAWQQPIFIAPPVDMRTELIFRLRVFDSKGQVGPNGIDYTSVFVEPSPEPPTIVLLDFELLPDGSLPVEFELVDDDYIAECALFRNFEMGDVSRPPEYRRFVPNNTIVWDNDRVFNPPPETTFNVTIDFTVPVASVIADVYVEPGASVTLWGFDETGLELGNATSEVSTDCCEFKTSTVGLTNLGWIYQVRFESSAPASVTPAIDNLQFERRTICN
jgi:hypothetical protein